MTSFGKTDLVLHGAFIVENYQLTKEEHKEPRTLKKQKIPIEELRRMYICLLSEIRQKAWSKQGRVAVNTALYHVGWQDGWNVGNRER